MLKPMHLDKEVQVKSVLTISWLLRLYCPARLQIIHSSTDTERHWLLLWVAFVPVCWLYRHFIPLLVLFWFQKSLAWIFNRHKERLWAAHWIESRRRFVWWLLVSFFAIDNLFHIFHGCISITSILSSFLLHTLANLLHFFSKGQGHKNKFSCVKFSTLRCGSHSGQRSWM